MTTIVINTDKNTFVGRFADVKSAEAATANVKYNPYFIGAPKDLESFTGPQLASIYNSTVPADKAVKKFASLGVARDRTWTQLKIAEAKPVAKAKSVSTTRCQYDETHVIRLEVDECPRRKKTGNGYLNWSLYKDGMTVGAYLDAREAADEIGGGLCEHFYWDVDKGYITVESL